MRPEQDLWIRLYDTVKARNYSLTREKNFAPAWSPLVTWPPPCGAELLKRRPVARGRHKLSEPLTRRPTAVNMKAALALATAAVLVLALGRTSQAVQVEVRAVDSSCWPAERWQGLSPTIFCSLPFPPGERLIFLAGGREAAAGAGAERHCCEPPAGGFWGAPLRWAPAASGVRAPL